MSNKSTITYKGEINKVFDIDPNTIAADVREQLQDANFIGVDSDSEAWRFFVYNTKSTKFSDAILAKELETIVPINGMYGPGEQLYLTNIEKVHNPDLMGIGTDWFFDQFMSCQVILNNEDESARMNNEGKFQPMMMTNVRPTSQRVAGIYDNVVVCEMGSSVSFNISSWGAAGFGYSIKPHAGQTIVDSLYITFGDNPNHVSKSHIYRYQDKAQQIVIDSTKSMEIPTGQTVQYQRVTVKTWRITSYKKNGKTYRSNAQPPGSLANAGEGDGITPRKLARAEIIPGDTIIPGLPHPGDNSKQTFGTGIEDIKQDDRNTQALGEIVIYFFVFKSHEDAERVIGQINAPSPYVWD